MFEKIKGGGNMSIEKSEEENGIGFVVICDSCKKELYATEFDDFSYLLAKMQDAGWKSRYSIKEKTWKHYCPECLLIK